MKQALPKHYEDFIRFCLKKVIADEVEAAARGEKK